MAFAITNFTLGGTTFNTLNGTVVHDYVAGNVKQFSGGEWQVILIPNKDKMREIRIVGQLETDAEKASLEGFRDSGKYTYADGVLSLDNVAVMSLSFNFSRAGSGLELWSFNLILQEFNQ